MTTEPSEARQHDEPVLGGKDPLRGSRTSGTWLGLVLAAVLLLLLIVFIAQNTQQVEISFFGWNGSAPLAVAVLAAAVTGLLATGLVGGLRLWQVRRRVRREERQQRQPPEA